MTFKSEPYDPTGVEWGNSNSLGPQAERRSAWFEWHLWSIKTPDDVPNASGEWVCDGQIIHPDQLEWYELNKAFVDTIGLGREGAIKIAGVPINRLVSPNTSNTGKSKGWFAGFCWIGKDGEKRMVYRATLGGKVRYEHSYP
jgi:hypothetical protein